MNKTEEKTALETLEFNDGYVYNEADDVYVVLLKKAGKNVCIPGDQHRAMQLAYCGEDGLTVESICYVNDFPPSLFDEYKRAFGWVRKGVILSDETIASQPIEASVKDILQHKKFEIVQEASKQAWRNTSEKAQKWDEFEMSTLKPFERILDGWAPPKLEPLPKKKNKSKSKGRWFVMSCSDFQVGNEAIERYLFRQKGWDSLKAHESIDKLMAKIAEDTSLMGVPFEGAYVLLAGDLFHGLKAKTEKGPELQCDITRDDQCDAVLNILYLIIGRMREIFGKVVVQSVRGNHDGTDFYPVMKALENYFNSYKSIEFNIHSARTAAFKISNTGVLLDHGASDLYKSKIPKDGKPREAYIQSLILTKPEEMIKDCNQRLFICGDLHSYEQIEYGDFEFIRTGALPLGDQYADNSNLNSRARQNCFIIDKDGLRQTLHYYIDSL